jgi:CBS domain-containing protein
MATVADVLREKDTRIITVRLRETVATAVELMKRENVHALVVKDVCRTEGNTVVGIFSERDVARGLAQHGKAVLDQEVASFLGRPLVSCALNDSLEAVLRLMDQASSAAAAGDRAEFLVRCDQRQRCHRASGAGARARRVSGADCASERAQTRGDRIRLV